MGTQAAENWILLLNLVAVAIYVCYTRGILRAANDQSEGLSKPVVTVVQQAIHRSRLDEARRLGLSSELAGYEMQLINIGTGPALEIRWQITQARASSVDAGTLSGSVPYLSPQSPYPIPVVTGSVEHGEVIRLDIAYRGLSGREYKSWLDFRGILVRGFGIGERKPLRHGWLSLSTLGRLAAKV